MAAFALLLCLTASAQAYLFKSSIGDAQGRAARATSTRIPDYLSGSFRKKPDIYFLVYDAYSAEHVLGLRGINNRQQMEILKNRRFVFYDKTYTVAADSKASISRVLDMAAPAIHSIGGNNVVNAVLQREGYRTHLVLTPYFLQDTQVFAADRTVPTRTETAGLEAIYKGILAGEFKAEFVFAFSDRGRGRDEWLAQKREVLASRTDYPKFLYAHSPFPSHSQISGSCLPNEAELFTERLALANEEMRQDVEIVLDSQRDAIIVIAGDHGPFLTGDCHHLQGWDPSQITAAELVDRYGAFLAIRWPDSLAVRFDDIHVLQDLFFAIFGTLAEDADVLSHRPKWRTVEIEPAIPAGAIEDDVVTFGRDAGRPLYPEGSRF
jgi:hypothetical protein